MSLGISESQICNFFNRNVSDIVEVSNPRKLALGVGVTTITAIAIGILFGPIPFLSFGFGVIFGFALRNITNENQKAKTNPPNYDVKTLPNNAQTDVYIIDIPTNSPAIPDKTIEIQQPDELDLEIVETRRQINETRQNTRETGLKTDKLIREMLEMKMD